MITFNIMLSVLDQSNMSPSSATPLPVTRPVSSLSQPAPPNGIPPNQVRIYHFTDDKEKVKGGVTVYPCQRSPDPIYIANYYMKLIKTT